MNVDLQFQFCPLDVTNITMAVQEEINAHTTDILAHTRMRTHIQTTMIFSSHNRQKEE